MDGELGDGRSNSRNGYGKKTLLTETGKLDISVPRDRLSTFDPQLIAKYRPRVERPLRVVGQGECARLPLPSNREALKRSRL